MTNGEKLRQLSDEDLLQFFFGPEAFTISMIEPVTSYVNGAQITRETTVRFLDWMKREAKE